MNQEQADVVVGVLLAGIVLVGVVGGAQFGLSGGPMVDGMGTPPVMAVAGPVLMSLVVASVVGVAYVFVRGAVFASEGADANAEGLDSAEGTSSDVSADGSASGASSDADGTDAAAESDAGVGEDAGVTEDGDAAEGAESSDAVSARDVLDVLPDDERRILEPVLESPGLTQVKVRDRAAFSKSKVSQTITDLEERGLVYRERQGRTYRVYPADDLEDRV